MALILQQSEEGTYMVVKRSLCMAVLLAVCVMGVSFLAEAQATIDFTHTPASPVVGQSVTFTAVIVEGDPTWFVAFEWDFDQAGPPTTYEATGRVVVYAFASAGTKAVTLRARDDRGGYHFVTKNVMVRNDPPVACFSYQPALPEAGEAVFFDASCSVDPDGSIASYDWAFSDGARATGQSIRHAFATAGTHWARLTVRDNGGLTDEETRSIAVQCVAPTAAFSYSPAAPTVNDSIQFQDLSTDPDGGTIVAWSWDFGNGSTSTARNPSHQYANGGTYNVTLLVRDDCGLTGVAQQSIAVAGPSAAFSYAPTNPTTQDTVQFFDQSTSPGDDVVSRSWDFGNGATSAVQNPTHRFATPGERNVRLTITTRSGATSSVTRRLAILNAPPLATFTFTPSAPKLGELVTFSAAGSGDPDGSVAMYEWDFTGDGVTDATGVSTTRSFAAAGARLVTLTVTDNNGAKSSVTRTVPVQATPPVASFTFTPADPYTGQVVTFNASASTDADGTIILYEWDFDGNGTPDATGMSVTRSFATSGVYPVSLKVTDNDLAIDVLTRGVPVGVGGTGGSNQAPVADFTFAPQEGDVVNLNEVVTFRADGSSDPDGTIVAYEWDFDRDGRYDATGKIVTFVFHVGGARIVQLRVTDNNGAYGYKTRVVSVEFVRPRAEFTYSPARPEVGDVITFDGGDSTDADGRIEFYEWDFDNDGRIDATGRTVNHTFYDGGSQAVTLIVTDNDGVTDHVTKRVPVTVNSPPVAGILILTPADQRWCGQDIQFGDGSTDPDGRVTQWAWTFGDGGTSAIQTPSHRYTCSARTTYTVSLTVTDDGGKTATATTSVTVSAPECELTIAQSPVNPVAKDQSITFTVTFTASGVSASDVASWAWSFGDGTTGTGASPVTHAYSADGAYNVNVVVTLRDGRTCQPRQAVRVVVGVQPTVSAYPNPASRTVTIRLDLPDGTTDVVLRVFDLVGRTLLEEDVADTAQTYLWNLQSSDGEDVPNGLYFVLVTAKDAGGRSWRSEIFKLLVVR